MSRVILVFIALLCCAVPAEARVWGAKSRFCPRLISRLAELEASPDTRPAHLARFRNRVADRCVALNEVQVLGTHNSYHVQPRPTLLSALLALSPIFQAWEYTHPPIGEQLESQGIRQLEIDVYADPDGGLFADRGALEYIGEDPISPDPLMMLPGFKALHIQDADFESNCTTFVGCLRAVKEWSDANRHHLPIMILIEGEDSPLGSLLGITFAVPVPLDATQLDALDAEIRSVFPASRLITPDRVRRGQPTLEGAVLTLGWPRLGALRGKVMFVLDNGGSIRSEYLAGHPSLSGRILFTDSSPGLPEAAFVKVNDPLANPATIPDLVAQGYLVRTRSDADTFEARNGSTTLRDAAIASGAQWVSTDYPVPDPDFGTGYVVEIPGGTPARCNPINAGPGCRDDGLERLP